MSDQWSTGTELKCADKCSVLEDAARNKIHVPLHITRVISAMCKKFPKDEWQMLLKGEIVDNNIHINGYYVPVQEVGGAFVENNDMITREFIKENNIIAGIHSHVDMGVFFSATDEQTNRSAIRYHIVVNNRGDTVARGRYKLACDREGFKDMDVEYEVEPTTDVEIEGVERVTVRSYHQPLQQSWVGTEYKGLQSTYDEPYTDAHGVTHYPPYQEPWWHKEDIEHTPKTSKRKKNKPVVDNHSLAGAMEGTYFYDNDEDIFYMDNGMSFEGKYALDLGG